MKTFTLLFAIIVICGIGTLQSQNIEWAKGWGGGLGNDFGFSVFVDASGNAYATGQFTGVVDFDPGPSTFNLTSSGFEDVFISKLNPAGNLVWARQIGGTSFDQGFAIASDAFGNVYIAGAFSGLADFDPGPGTFNLAASGSTDIFICKLNSAGNFIWAKQIGGLSDDWAISLAVDMYGNIYTTGLYSQLVDFDPGPGVFNLTSLGPISIFISKLDASGNFGWAKSIDGPSNTPYSITLDASRNIYITGYFASLTDFDPGAGSTYLIPAGFQDVFITKSDSTGNLIWAKGFGGPNNDIGTSIKTDASGNVYTGGIFSGTADFDPGAGTYNLTSGPGFISKLNAAGNFVWAKEIGGVINGIDLDVSGNGAVFAAGNFTGTADFDPDTAVFNLTTSFTANHEIFISKLDTSGHFLLVKHTGKGADAFALSIDVDASGHAYVAGDFYGNTISFDTTTYSTAGGADVFLAKLNCSNTVFLNATACKNYISPGGNFNWTQSGNYIDTKTNAGTCDSVFVISLIVNHPDTTVLVTGTQGTSNASGSTFQWVDCNNNYSPIIGETNSVFTATVNGSYAVLVTENGCTDTSSCYFILGVGIDDSKQLKNGITFYPVPVNNELLIKIDQPSATKEIGIYNILGEELLKTNCSGNCQEVKMDMSSLAPGIYVLNIFSEKGYIAFKLVKQ